MMLKVFEAFAGYGSQRMALRNLGIKHEVVATSEVDEYAILSYGAIHGSNLDKELPESEEVIKECLTKINVPLTDKGKLKNLRGKRLRRLYNALDQSNGLGDISKIDVSEVPDHDLFTYSFPCQDISVAGTQGGFDKGSGTRSGLLWECQRIISAKRPKYLLMENVKNLVSKKFKPGFEEWQEYLTSIGYTNYWEVLNAKDFGIPQNRERVFMVSILGEHGPYVFPEPIKLEKRLKDVLEEEVDEKYYLDNERSQQLVATITDGNALKTDEKDNYVVEPKIKKIGNIYPSGGQAGKVYDPNGISVTVTGQRVNSQGYLLASDNLGVIEPKIKQIGNTTPNPKRENPQTGRTYDADGLAPTLNTMQGGNRQPQIVEPKIAASRGRNPENPSDRTKGAPTEQRLEVNDEGTSNTLTTVQKDNYVVETVRKLAKKSRPNDDIEISVSENGDIRPHKMDAKKSGIQELNINHENNPSHTVTTNHMPKVYGTNTEYRIRKLTPLECWRLMDVSDEDFYKAQEVNSNSQLYKQAGNSIVVSVLEAIFRNMFLEVPDEDIIDEHIPLF